MLQHSCHDHPLDLLDLSGHSNPSCHLCRRRISAEAYTCDQDCSFHLHRSCAEAPPLIERHPFHPHHPLILLHLRSPFVCRACGECFESGLSSFRCDECNFDLGLSCALSTAPDHGGNTLELISHPLHPHHLASFSTRHDYVEGDNCDVCRESVQGDGCICLDKSCKFLTHKGCIQDLYHANRSNILLRHPTHYDPLRTWDSRRQPEFRDCTLCRRKISGAAYACQGRCDSFYLHRACAEAPFLIESHPLHPDHPLTLIHHRRPFECYVCGDIFERSDSSFSCSKCDFDLDLSCALFTLSDEGCSLVGKSAEKINHPLHSHQLTSFSKRHDLVEGDNCEICLESVEVDGYTCLHRRCRYVIHSRCIQDMYYADGTQAPHVYHGHQLKIFREDGHSIRCAYCEFYESGEFIGCADCKVFYHRYCIQMPQIIQYPAHPGHALVLFIDFPVKHTRGCESCSGSSKGELIYGCTVCDFFLHVRCALQIFAYLEEGMSIEIKWSWHEHPLRLSHRIKSGSEYCCFCFDELNGPTYACKVDGCGLLLHERCFRIQSTMFHPYHPDHPLTLHQADYRSPQLCKACCREIIGFEFFCELCAFYLHVKCATRVPDRKHHLHEHELLRFDAIPSLECNRCSTSTDSPLFRCVPCNFNLHEKCMELPKVLKSEIHWHPLTLHDIFLEDDTGEYYCEHCEKPRDGRLGVYVCREGECKSRSIPWIFHIECALPDLGKVYSKKIQDSVIKRLAKQIAEKKEKVCAAKEKLKKMEQEMDELEKRHAELVFEEKNCTTA